LTELDPEMLGHDPGPHLVERVVPRKRSEMCTGSVPPEHSQLVQLRQPCSRSLDALEVKFEQLIGGKDSMLVKVKTDQLISFGNR
jgi:hypothetical protein